MAITLPVEIDKALHLENCAFSRAALPNDVTLMQEVDTKIFAPESSYSNSSPRPQTPSLILSVQLNSASVSKPAKLQRHKLFRLPGFKIQKMLVSLKENNHVITPANEVSG